MVGRGCGRRARTTNRGIPAREQYSTWRQGEPASELLAVDRLAVFAVAETAVDYEVNCAIDHLHRAVVNPGRAEAVICSTHLSVFGPGTHLSPRMLVRGQIKIVLEPPFDYLDLHPRVILLGDHVEDFRDRHVGHDHRAAGRPRRVEVYENPSQGNRLGRVTAFRDDCRGPPAVIRLQRNKTEVAFLDGLSVHRDLAFQMRRWRAAPTTTYAAGDDQ